MNQKPEQQKPVFQFAAGSGTIRAKIAAEAVIHSGRLTLPVVGPCFVDGHRAKDAVEMVLDVKRSSDRQVVAKLVLPCGEDAEQQAGAAREGKLTLLEAVKFGGQRRTVFPVRATLRWDSTHNAYLPLRLPDVKSVGAAAF